MAKDRFTLKAAVYLLLERNGKLLFLRRFNTGWMDGHYTLPSGHIDGRESICQAMAREAHEETNISIKAKDLEVIHVMHRIDYDDEYIDFFVRLTNSWHGKPKINEPDKCDEITWFDKNNLSNQVLDNVKAALNHIAKQEPFSEFNNIK